MNTRLLRRVQKHILEEPKRVNMKVWKLTGFDISYRGLKVPKCGTVGCIRGWATVLTKKKVHSVDVQSGYNDDLMQLSEDQAQRLYFAYNWPEKFRVRLSRCNPQTKAYARVVSDRIDHFIATRGRE